MLAEEKIISVNISCIDYIWGKVILQSQWFDLRSSRKVPERELETLPRWSGLVLLLVVLLHNSHSEWHNSIGLIENKKLARNHNSVGNSELRIVNLQFQMWQVCCPKGSHWQLGLIYEYGSAIPSRNAIAAIWKISSAFLQNSNKV